MDRSPNPTNERQASRKDHTLQKLVTFIVKVEKKKRMYAEKQQGESHRHRHCATTTTSTHHLRGNVGADFPYICS